MTIAVHQRGQHSYGADITVGKYFIWQRLAVGSVFQAERAANNARHFHAFCPRRQQHNLLRAGRIGQCLFHHRQPITAHTKPRGAASRRAVFVCLHRLSSALIVAWGYEIARCYQTVFLTRFFATRAGKGRACYNSRRFCAPLRMVNFEFFGGN